MALSLNTPARLAHQPRERHYPSPVVARLVASIRPLETQDECRRPSLDETFKPVVSNWVLAGAQSFPSTPPSPSTYDLVAIHSAQRRTRLSHQGPKQPHEPGRPPSGFYLCQALPPQQVRLRDWHLLAGAVGCATMTTTRSPPTKIDQPHECSSARIRKYKHIQTLRTAVAAEMGLATWMETLRPKATRKMPTVLQPFQ